MPIRPKKLQIRVTYQTSFHFSRLWIHGWAPWLCSEVGEKEAKRTSILRLASLHILNGSGIIVRTLGLKRERKMKRYELKKREEKLWIETIRVWSVKYWKVCELDVKFSEARVLSVKYRNFSWGVGCHGWFHPTGIAVIFGGFSSYIYYLLYGFFLLHLLSALY
jgi:hypothetical protein